MVSAFKLNFKRSPNIQEKMIGEKYVKSVDRTDREGEQRRKLREREAGIERIGDQRAEENKRVAKPPKHLPPSTQRNDKVLK